MIIKEPRTKSKERRKRDLEFNYFSKSQEEDKPRTNANFLKTVSKSTKLAYTTTWLLMMAAILETPTMISPKDLLINTNKTVSI